MEKLYTALSVSQYRELLKTKKLPLMKTRESILELEFTEDKSYWVEQLKNQEDLENVADYRYSFVMEFGMKGAVLNPLIESNVTGRLSKKIIQYYKQLNKPMILPELKNEEINILCILDVYKSDETQDGISQRWILKTDSAESDLWQSFNKGVFKISCIGGIPGAMEAAETAQ